MGKKPKSENVQVIVRVRPFNERERREEGTEATALDFVNQTVTVNECGVEGRAWGFDAVYDNKFSQKDVYNTSIRPLVDTVLEGYNSTIFAYGQSGTGKTYSMCGLLDKPDHLGIIPHAINHIFDFIRAETSDMVSFNVQASFVELYLGKCRDLLTSDSNNLELRENAQKLFYVKDLTLHNVSDMHSAMSLMEEGLSRREVKSTKLNADSSRSHSVFSVYIRRHNKQDDTRTEAKLMLVDLAGSERQSKTEAEGAALAEGSAINQSLTALGTVIDCLVHQKPHIPYRSSPLTMLLKDGLGGNSRTVIVGTLSPSSTNAQETVSTLRFVDRAKQIKNKPKLQMDPKDLKIHELTEELAELKARFGLDGGAAGGGGGDGGGDDGDGGAGDDKTSEHKQRYAKSFESELMALRSRVEQLEVALTEAKEEGARAQQTVATAEGRFQRERDELKQTIADAAHERQQLIDSHTLEHAGAGGSVPEQYAELQSICTNFIQTIDPKGAVVPIKKGAFASAEAIANAFHLIAGNAVLSSGAGNSPSGGGGAGSGDDAGSPEGGLLQRRRSFASGSLRNVVASAAVVTSPLSTAAAPAATASKPKKDRKRADPSADFSDVATIEGGALADATVAEYVKKIGATPADAKSGKNVQAVLDELLLKQRQVLHRAMFAALRSASPRGASAGSGGDLSSDNMDVEKTVLAAYDHANDEIERLTEAVLKQKQFATATKEIADKRADEVAQTKALLAKAKEEAAAKHAQHAADLEAVQGNLIGQNNKRLEKLVAKHTKDLSKERKARDAMQAHIDQAAEERSEALRQRDVSIMELESMREQFEATKVELLKMMRSRNASQGSSGYGENVGHSFPGGASGTATMPMSAMSAAQQQQARVDRLRNDVSRAESHTSGGYGANLRPGGGGLPPMNGLPPLRAGPAAGAASAR